MKPHWTNGAATLYHGSALDVLRSLPDGCAHTCVTSPPYFNLRRYEDCDPAEMIGLEATPDCLAWARSEPPCGACFVCKLRLVFAEVFRVLVPGSCAWVNLGDSYAGSGRGPTGTNGIQHAEDRQGFTNRNDPRGPRRNKTDAQPGYKAKDLMGIPWRAAFALQADGWYLRDDIVWVKGASFGPFHGTPMPESVTDRPTRAHEFLFLLANAREYHYDAEAVKEPCSTTTHAVVTDSRGAKNGSGTAGEVRGAGAFEGYRPERRNLRDCWTLLPDRSEEDHYAAFPRSLVRPCVLAGTSGRGVCAKCGSPWERDTSEPPNIHPGDSGKNDMQGTVQRGKGRDGKAIGTIMRERFEAGRTRSTIGWSPSCRCTDAGEPVPAIVLDPFAGTGTTGVVALEEGRRFMGIDLSAKYLNTIARPRLEAARKGVTVREERAGQAVLF